MPRQAHSLYNGNSIQEAVTLVSTVLMQALLHSTLLKLMVFLDPLLTRLPQDKAGSPAPSTTLLLLLLLLLLQLPDSWLNIV